MDKLIQGGMYLGGGLWVQAPKINDLLLLKPKTIEKYDHIQTPRNLKTPWICFHLHPWAHTLQLVLASLPEIN